MGKDINCNNLEQTNLSVVMDNVVSELKKNKIIIEDTSQRLKSPESILHKMLRKNLSSVKELTDILASRIVVEDQISCYRSMDVITDLCKIRNIEDYIFSPKENNYRAIHLIISHDSFKSQGLLLPVCLEIQVRSKEMHNIAEVGQANHDKYKELQFDEIDQSSFKHLLNVPRINKLIDEASYFANQFNWNIDKFA